MIGHTLTRHLTGLVSLLPWFSSRLLLVRPHPALTGAPTGERIRDKIAASKRKGIWMGGVPPLGYDVDKRLLVVNDTEAAVVRRISRICLSSSLMSRSKAIFWSSAQPSSLVASAS